MVTINDVAKHAGVSPVTVSRVVNNSDYVSHATREKVEKAIDELGYIPSFMARGLRINKTFTLALILPDITNVFWTTVARGVEDAAMRNNYSILVYNVDEDEQKQKRAIEVVLSQQVDGVMIAPHDRDINHLGKLIQTHTPTVILDRKVDEGTSECGFDYVRDDSISGAFTLTEHLIRLGHRRIAMVSGNLHTSTAQDRVEGYRLALEKYEIPFDSSIIRYGEYKVDAGKAMIQDLFKSGADFTCVFAANNAIGMGVVSELLDRDLRIPEDYAVVFYDDYSNASSYFPFFTVVMQDPYRIGKIAAECLFERINQPDLPGRTEIFPSEFIVRYSCGARIDATGKSPLSLPVMETAGVSETKRTIQPFVVEV
ncbi:MAG: LacI family DNA-binding transcriptional regulator [Anaerolineae bacterium]|nr:LacI family DNA-binding transcriptional regulator [Anaerolineae bacterium]